MDYCTVSLSHSLTLIFYDSLFLVFPIIFGKNKYQYLRLYIYIFSLYNQPNPLISSTVYHLISFDPSFSLINSFCFSISFNSTQTLDGSCLRRHFLQRRRHHRIRPGAFHSNRSLRSRPNSTNQGLDKKIQNKMELWNSRPGPVPRPVQRRAGRGKGQS